MRHLVSAVIALLMLGLLAGCAAPATEESLQNATLKGDPPTGVMVEHTNLGRSLSWEPNPDAVGWQVQISENGETGWVGTHVSMLDVGDTKNYGGASVDYRGAASQIWMRVRAVYSSTEASEWVSVGPIDLGHSEAGTTSTSCSSALAAAEAASDPAESELRQSLSACASKAEWSAAAQQAPLAMGLTRASASDAMQFLGILCRSYPTEGICAG